MRQVLFLILLLIIPLTAFATWQPSEGVAGTSAVKVPFYSDSAIAAGAAGASGVQVKNTGEGTLSVSLWRFEVSAWKGSHPFGALVGEPFYTIADSVYTLAPGETLFLDDIAASRRPHAAQLTRPVSTSYRVLWK